MNKFNLLQSLQGKTLAPGTYTAKTSGCKSVVVQDGVAHVFKFKNGVRGLNIRDVLTVKNDGTVTSNILGLAIEQNNEQC